ncbi:MAG: hypothetical protein R3D44_08425 [Hyphomicrobiaceae bacterium]
MSRSSASFAFGLFAAATLLVSGSDAANARCTKLGFSVNDYGKDGPTKDAKALLDKYIANWTAQRGIKRYTTGKKNVTCELFLDFGIFDEHTCKATATVCWSGDPAPSKTPVSTPRKGQATDTKPAVPQPAPSAPPSNFVRPKAA